MPKARIKPFNKQRGHLVQRYSTAGTTFRASHGWYDVSPKMGRLLRNKATGSKRVFDVCTPEEADAIDHAEAEALLEHHDAERPQSTVMTTDERRELKELRKLRREREARTEAAEMARVESGAGLPLSVLMARFDTMSVADVWQAVRTYPAGDLGVVIALEKRGDDRPELMSLLHRAMDELEGDAEAIEGEPFPGYEGMSIKHVIAELEDATPEDLARVLAYEEASDSPRITLMRELNARLEEE